MSNRSNNNGRAYEYAFINILRDNIKDIRRVEIEKNSSWKANESAWNCISGEVQELFITSASSTICAILELEPKISEDLSGQANKTSNSKAKEDKLVLEFQSDDAGVAGDVRDILLKRDAVAWEIGLSIKHNHNAVKHSRLSYKLDFGNEWFGVPCSSKYWEAVKPVFDFLKQEKTKGTRWSDIKDKNSTVYVPLLEAFMAEINRASKKDKQIPRKMIEYLVGRKDYYKIVSHDNLHLTLIHTFNIYGTLNKPSKTKFSAFTVPVLDLPTEIVAMQFKTKRNGKKSSNTIEMYLNRGWQLQFRIHSASTKAEPSLKFDISFIGMPASVMNIECKWSK